MRRRRVRIVCTLGPASRGRECILALARAGMDVARINFSHGDQAEHAEAIRNVRDVERELDRPIAILADLAGPKIRLGEIPGGSLLLKRGAEITLSSRQRPGRDGVLGTTYPHLARDVAPGDRVLLDDGRLRLEVVAVRVQEVRCRVVEGGTLRRHKGINLPGVALSAPALSARDKRDLAFALDRGVDLVALSFVRCADDLRRASRLIHRLRGGGPRQKGRHPFATAAPPLIAKLEKPEALDDLEAILSESGAVMVARGDLGVEIAPEEVPPAQKRIIRRANALGRPVITATQMLESMTERSRPTRAEASDVANAVLDGTDAVMLSAETASGRYPEETVRMMDRIVRAAEASRRTAAAARLDGTEALPQEAVSRAAVTLAHALDVVAIIAFTNSGTTALRLARLRPAVPVVALSPDRDVVRRLELVWGVVPRVQSRSDRLRQLTAGADSILRGLGIARDGDAAVLVMGYPPGTMGRTNLVKVHRIGEST